MSTKGKTLILNILSHQQETKSLRNQHLTSPRPTNSMQDAGQDKHYVYYKMQMMFLYRDKW